MSQVLYPIRSAYRDEWDDAMALAWKTFMQFEADVYTAEGIRSFEDFITDTTLHAHLAEYIAYLSSFCR